MSRIILVSNRLPIRLADGGKPVRTTGGLASALEGAGVLDEAIWVGWPGVSSAELEENPAMGESLAELGVVPVSLSAAEMEGFYEGYSNSTLWPLLHQMLDRARFESGWAEAYRAANERFAEAVLRVAKEGDTVWVHDYHLFLLPELLREALPGLRIGFFLHTPFPSSDIVRALPERAEILRGLLGADLIGFHTYNYLRHFRSALLRVLGVESEVDSLWHTGRTVRLGVYPIGHNHRGFQEVMRGEAFREAMAVHGGRLRDRRMILSVERLDYTKGVPQKLEAIRRFLERYPARREDCIFVIVAVPSRQGVDEYDELTDDVQREVGAINGQYGSVGQTPVQFLHRGFPPAELAAFYALADACLVTPLIDGMNLVAKEFIDCKRGAEGSRPGVLILSEFAGAAQEMSHAILVNPYDLDGVADSIARALEMPADAMERRAQAMQARLDRNDAGAWARHILGDLGDTEKARTYRTDEGAMPALADEIAAACAGGQDFALFLDYDGTLRGFTADPDDAVPDPELVPLLRRLCQKPAIAGRIAVVSGRPGSFLEKHLGETGATLVAEHGYLWRRSAAGKFTKVHPRVDTSWKEMILPHLRQAADLTPGSQIEEKRSAVVWHYRRADPEFGLWRAHELLSDLTEISANLPVAVHHGKKIVEVSSLLVSKGTATDLLLKEWRPNHALAAGDDQTDETMFALEPKSVKFYTVNVGGSTSTRARHRASIRGLRRFLETLDANLPS